MRLLPALLALLAACDAPAPAGPPPETNAEAARLLASVDREAVAGAFEALHAGPYTAAVEVVSSGDGAGTESATVRVEGAANAEVRMIDGDLDPTDGAPRLRDPVASTLPEDPPYLDPATRDQYRLGVVGDTVVSGRRLRLAEAVFVGGPRRQPVRRVRAAVDPASGRPGMVEVERVTESTLFDETTRVRVDLAAVDGVWVPHRVVTDTRTDVPLASPRRVSTRWTVVEAAGRRLGPSSTRR